jgi:basic membrane protein A
MCSRYDALARRDGGLRLHFTRGIPLLMATLTKRALAGFAAAGAAALVLAGCAGGAAETEEAADEAPAETEETEEAPEQLDFLACAVSDEGSWNDKSFNEAVYDGLQLAESELGAWSTPTVT